MRTRWVVSFLLALLAYPAAAAELAVQSDFEGGSVKVLAIDQPSGAIRFQPGGDPSRGWPCWWYFQVTGIEPGRVVTIELDMTGVPLAAGWAMPRWATFSTDRRSWRRTAPGQQRDKRMVYRQEIGASEAWFAWGPPFLPSDAQAVVRAAAERCPQARPFELCRSAQGRAVPAVRIGPAGGAGQKRPGVWIHARQHAWETGSSWVCCGLMEWLASDEPRARSLRDGAEVVLVPIMDVDNVADGQGGKNQRPHDHNRDWSDKPVFPAVAAAQRQIEALESSGGLCLFLDLHNPGWNDLEPFFNSPEKSEHPGDSWQRVERFLAGARREITGPIAYQGRFAQTGPRYDPKAWQVMSEHWVRRHTGPQAIILALETPWNLPESTVEGYKTLGCQLGLAVERYLSSGTVRQ